MNIESMKAVTEDLDQRSRWYYSSDEKRYYRYLNGKITGKIKGNSLPDPYMLEISYKKQKDLLPDEEKQGFRVQASPVTHNLWKHWQGVKNG